MVSIHHRSNITSSSKQRCSVTKCCLLSLFLFIVCYLSSPTIDYGARASSNSAEQGQQQGKADEDNNEMNNMIVQLRRERWHKSSRPAIVHATFTEDEYQPIHKKRSDAKLRKFGTTGEASDKNAAAAAAVQAAATAGDIICPYQSIDNFTIDELYPKEGIRHQITPPSGGNISHVCCTTTKGPLSFVIHHKWAPLGAQRVYDMVTSGYFSYSGGVPLMRCVSNFLCQFGIHSDTSQRKKFNSNLKDDPNWLREGKDYRMNDKGVKRFAKGYMAYAGAGPNSRGKQLIVALAPNGPLGGGSPWEVPWGEVVGDYSFDTLDAIYTGYGENGPKQGKLSTEGMTEAMKSEFPQLDYITSCTLVDRRDMSRPQSASEVTN